MCGVLWLMLYAVGVHVLQSVSDWTLDCLQNQVTYLFYLKNNKKGFNDKHHFGVQHRPGLLHHVLLQKAGLFLDGGLKISFNVVKMSTSTCWNEFLNIFAILKSTKQNVKIREFSLMVLMKPKLKRDLKTWIYEYWQDLLYYSIIYLEMLWTTIGSV